MTLAEMEEEFRRTTAHVFADTDPDWSTAKVQALIGEHHQYVVPELLDGEFTEGEWVFETAQGTYQYPYGPDAPSAWPPSGGDQGLNKRVAGLRGVVFRDDVQIAYETRLETVRYWHRVEDLAEATPYTALVYGFVLELRPVPNAAYTIRAKARLYPAALTAAGLVYRPRALAAVYSAAYEASASTGMAKMAAKNAGLRDENLTLCGRRSQRRPRTRKPRRSF